MTIPGRASMTKEFLNYLQYEKRYSPHTLVSYKSDLDQLNNFITDQYPETPIQEVNHAVLRDWIISLSTNGLNSKSINRKLVTVRSFFKFLVRKGVLHRNPASRLTHLKTKKGLPHFVREQDMNMLLDHHEYKDAFEDRRDQLVIELLYGTGIRLSELIGLKEKAVDLVNNSIKVLGKRNKERIIPVPLGLLLLIKNYISLKNEAFEGNANEFLIVSNKGMKCYPMMINRIVKKYLQGASVDKKSPHILRHTYATHLLERGADLNAVKDLLGHQSLAATQVYTHNSLGKLKKVFDQAHPKA
jgi:integrase/recombinase XerC